MANVIKLKRGSGSDPSASDLVVGEVAIRTDSGKLFTKKDNGTIAEISGSGGGSDIFINTLSSSSGSGGGSATFNGTATRFTLSNPPAVSAQQLLVSINGVIQKPNSGTSPSEGFAIDGNDIIFAAAPATGSDFFIVTYGSLNIAVPADNSVTSAKIADGAIVNADINASAAIAGSKINPSFGNQAVTSTNSITLDGSVGDTIIKASGAEIEFTRGASSNITCSDSSGSLNINTGGSNTRLKIDSSGNVQIPNDSGKLQLGASQDLQLFHDGNNSVITAGGAGDLQLTSTFDDVIIQAADNIFINPQGGEDGLKVYGDGEVELFFDGAKKFDTYAAGVEVNGNLYIKDGDSTNNRVALGTNGDLNLYHDGTNSLITNTTGVFVVKGDDYRIKSYSTDEEMIHAHVNAGVELYFDNSKKLEVFTWGVEINGDLGLDDNRKLALGNLPDFDLFHDGSNSFIRNQTGQLQIQTNTFGVTDYGGNEYLMFAGVNGSAYLYYDGSNKIQTLSGGAKVSGQLQATSGFLTVDAASYLISNSSVGSSSTTYYIGNQAIQTSSDRRIKENIVNTEVDALSELKKVRVVDFNWNDPSDTAVINRNSRGKWTGCIAQEIVDVFPFAVNAPRSEDNKIDNNSETLWGMEYGQLVPVLIKAIQDLNAKVEALEAG